MRSRISCRPILEVSRLIRASSDRTVGPAIPSSASRRFCWKSSSASQGVGAEDPVDVSGVEPEGIEAPLQLGDIVAVEHGHPQIELSIPEHESGIDHRSPRLGSNEAIHRQAPLVLE